MSENINNDLCPLHNGNKLKQHKPDYKKFQAMLNEHSADKPVTEAEAADAYRNLGEFVSLLVRINEREKIVKMEDYPE